MLLLLLLQKVVVGNSATATNAEKLGGKSSTEYIVKGDFAVLTGTIKTNVAGGTDNTAFNTLQIDFPANFNSENCVVLSLAMYHGTNNKYAFGSTNLSDSRTWLRDGVGAMITFDYKGNGKITLTVETPFTQEYTYKYKIVLMKIS